MGFIEDPDQFEDFPQDPDDYESIGYEPLDADGKYIIEIFRNMDIDIDESYVEQLIEDLIVDGGLNDFAVQLETVSAYFMPPGFYPDDSLRANPFFSADDALEYLDGIPGWEGFAGLTWINGTWMIWVGDTI